MLLLTTDPSLVFSRDEDRRIPLHIAARFGPKHVVEWLIEKGSDVNATAYNDFTPMHLVSEGEIAALLIKAGANLDKRSVWGRTPLQNAAQHEHTNVVATILDSGYKLDLTTALMEGDREAAKEIIRTNPISVTDITAGSDLWGCATPLGVAAGDGDIELVNLLLAAGADANEGSDMPDAMAPATALSMAVWAERREVVKVLLARGARVERSAGGRKFYGDILDYAEQHSSAAIIRFLKNAPRLGPRIIHPFQQRRKRFQTGVWVLVILVGAAGVWWWRRSRHPHGRTSVGL